MSKPDNQLDMKKYFDVLVSLTEEMRDTDTPIFNCSINLYNSPEKEMLITDYAGNVFAINVKHIKEPNNE